jgi:hypothetical protein
MAQSRRRSGKWREFDEDGGLGFPMLHGVSY